MVKQGKRTGRESFWDVNGEDTLFALGGMLQALYTECVTEESSRAAIAQLAQGGGARRLKQPQSKGTLALLRKRLLHGF